MFTKILHRPALAIVISIILLFLGLLGIFTLPVEQFPSITPPTVQVSIAYPGAIGNQTIGTTGVGGMLLGTVVGIFFIPGLYYVFARIADGRKLLRDDTTVPLSELPEYDHPLPPEENNKGHPSPAAAATASGASADAAPPQTRPPQEDRSEPLWAIETPDPRDPSINLPQTHPNPPCPEHRRPRSRRCPHAGPTRRSAQILKSRPLPQTNLAGDPHRRAWGKSAFLQNRRACISRGTSVSENRNVSAPRGFPDHPSGVGVTVWGAGAWGSTGKVRDTVGHFQPEAVGSFRSWNHRTALGVVGGHCLKLGGTGGRCLQWQRSRESKRSSWWPRVGPGRKAE